MVPPTGVTPLTPPLSWDVVLSSAVDPVAAALGHLPRVRLSMMVPTCFLFGLVMLDSYMYIVHNIKLCSLTQTCNFLIKKKLLCVQL